MENNKYTKKLAYRISLLVTILGLLSLISGTSYAILRGSASDSNEQIITTGDVSLELTENYENLNAKVNILSDSEGLLQDESFEFNIKNIGSIPAYYDIKIVNKAPEGYSGQILPLEYLKAGLEINGEEYGPFNLSELDGLIDSGVIYKKEIINYKLRIWLDSEREEELKNMTEYKAFLKLQVEAEQRVDGETYEVIYDANGGEGRMYNSIFLYDETNKLRKNTFTREEYDFIGWSTNKDATEAEYADEQEVRNLPVDANEVITLYAVWLSKVPTEYAISYTLNGGSVTGNPFTYNKETETFTLINPTRIGYNFIGWTGSNGDSPSLTVTIEKGSIGDREYIANWEAKQYTIESNNIYVVSPEMTVKYGENKVGNYVKPERQYIVGFNENSQGATISSLDDLTVKYEFDGFYINTSTKLIDSEGNLMPNVEGYTDSEGRWIGDFTSSTFVDDVYKGDVVYPELAPVVTLPQVEKDGYSCKWNSRSDGSGNSYDSSEVISGLSRSMTLYAVCNPNTYTITLDNQDATTPGSTSVTVTYGSSSLSITNPKREYTLNYSANNQGATISSVDPVTTSNSFLGWYDKKSGLQVINSSGNFVKNVSGYTDSNGNWVRKSNATLTARWAGHKQVTLSTISKTGHTCSWNTNASGTGQKYDSGGTTYLGENINLYAICTPNTYTITYDSYSGSGCSGTKQVTYGEPIGELCTPTKANNYMFVGWYDDSKAVHDNSLYYKDHPWLYYADTYGDLYNAFGYNEDSLYNHYDTYITNGTETRRKSQYLSSDVYSIAGDITLHAGWYKLWEGIPLGNYSAGQTVTYAGKKWTVVRDNGENTGLALNGASGHGGYDNAGTYLTNTFLGGDATLSRDRDNGGLVEQGDNIYATTDSGIATGYTGLSYWLNGNQFYNSTTRNHFELVADYFINAGTSPRGGAPLNPKAYNTKTKTVATTSAGVHDFSSSNYSVNKSTGVLTFNNSSSTRYTTTDYYSQKMMEFIIQPNSACTPSTDKLCYTLNNFNLVNGSFEANGSSIMPTDVSTVDVRVCGGIWHQKHVIYSYYNSTIFYYANQATGTGWPGENFDTSTAQRSYYTSSNGNYIGRFAGYREPNCANGDYCDSNVINSATRYKRNYYLDDSEYCNHVDFFQLTDFTLTLSYRPYIIVRER